MQRTLDEHYAFTTGQLAYLQEKITTVFTQIQDLANTD